MVETDDPSEAGVSGRLKLSEYPGRTRTLLMLNYCRYRSQKLSKKLIRMFSSVLSVS